MKDGHSLPFSTRAVPGPVRSRCLISNQFFPFRPPKNWLSARKTGSTAAPTLCWSRTKNRLRHGLGAGTKPVFEELQREMATAGYNRNIEQINNKLRKKDYRDQKRDLGRSGAGWPRKNPHFDLLDSVHGDRSACQLTGALNSATALLEDMVDDTTPSSTDPRKRKRDYSQELLRYLERADERFLQHSKDMNDALLQKMEADTSALLGLMGCMVALMEGQANK